jgi:hypothetical protein
VGKEPDRCEAEHPQLTRGVGDYPVLCGHGVGHIGRHIAVYTQHKTQVSWDQEKEDE